MVAADVGRAPAGGRSPEGGSGGGTPAGPSGRFPHPRARYLASALPRPSPAQSQGVEGRAEPGGGLKTRAARRDPWAAARRATVPSGVGVSPAEPLCGRRPRTSHGQPCRGGGPTAPPLRGPVSAEGPAARSAVAGLPASKRGDPGGERGLSAGARGESPRWGLAGRPPAPPRLRRGAALRSAPPSSLFPRPGERSAVSRRRLPARVGTPGERRRRRSPRPSAGGGPPLAAVVPARARPVARSSAIPGRAGLAGGWAGASHSRSPRGNGESGRRPRLSALRLPPGACLWEGSEARSGGGGFRAGNRFGSAADSSGRLRAGASSARAPVVAATGAAAEPRSCRRGERAFGGRGEPAVAARRGLRGGCARGRRGAPPLPPPLLPPSSSGGRHPRPE